MKAKLGIAPIAWWNDDLAELSDDVSLEECLRQASVAGFTGMETGRRFPMNMDELGPILARYGVSVCGGWFSGLLLDGDIEREKDRILAQMDFFIAAGAPCIVYGETARSIQGVRSAPLAAKPKLSEEEIRVYGRKMTEFGEWCAGQGMPIAYHHHMAAAIETEAETWPSPVATCCASSTNTTPASAMSTRKTYEWGRSRSSTGAGRVSSTPW